MASQGRRVDEAPCVSPPLDDPDLFERLTALEAAADPLYRPTKYWQGYADRLTAEIRRRGLAGFRRRADSVLSSFSATDHWPVARLAIPGEARLRSASQAMGSASPRMRSLVRNVARRARRYLVSAFPVAPARPPEWDLLYHHRLVRKKFNANGWDLRPCGTDRLGAPEAVIEIDGALWSANQLDMASLIADMGARIDLSGVGTVCEVGPGMGRSAQILKALRPNATILLFDIMPQLYVANQYLAAALPGQVIGAAEALRLVPGDQDRIRGKVVLLPAWKMPEWRRLRIDLFMNSVSFQEMETEVVANYLAIVRDMAPAWIYLNTMPGGAYYGGGFGIAKPMPEDIYTRSLTDYDLVATYETDHFCRPVEQISYVLRRRAAG